MTKSSFLLVPLVAASLWILSDSHIVAQVTDAKLNQKPKHKFTITEETTYILGPLDKDGYIDYAAALNERLSKGVTPENNANVLIWKAIGPAPERVPMPAEFFKMMGMDPLPEKGEYFVTSGKFIQSLLKGASAEVRDKLLRSFYDVGERPWTAKESPETAAWLKTNEKLLLLVQEAAKRSRYYLPLVRGNSDIGLSDHWFPNMSSPQAWREPALALRFRANLHAGEDRIDEAWSDIDACRQLGRLMSQGGTLIEGIVGMFIGNLANDAELSVLGRGKATTKGIETRLLALRSSPPKPGYVDQLDFGERLIFLNRCLALERLGVRHFSHIIYGVKDETLFATLDADTKRLVEDVHWDEALRGVNKLFDRMVGALRMKDRAARDKEFDQIEEKIKKCKEITESVSTLIKTYLEAGNAAGRGKVLADMIIAEHNIDLRALQRGKDRAEQNHRNLVLALALDLHKREHGKYPPELSVLAPKYVPEIPDDVFTGKAPVYRTIEAGYLLYSVGPNGVDDQGRGFGDEPKGGDDLAIRMPLPSLKK